MNDSGEYTDNDIELEDDGVLEPDEDLTTDDYQDDPLDTGIEPPDRYGASTWYGITEAEAKQGESLDQLLAEEEPDVGVDLEDDEEDEDDELLEEDEAPAEDAGEAEIDDRWPDGPGPRSGRLVSDGRLTATDVGANGGAAGAEEAAVHLLENNEIRYRPKDADS